MTTKKRKKRSVRFNTVQQTRQEQPEIEILVVSEEYVNPKQDKPGYEMLFIKESNITARLKTVYVRKEFYERILKIIQVIGNNEVSLFSYIDNVLAHHFKNFQREITTLYKQKQPNLF